MATKSNHHGIIEISPTAISTLVSHVVTETYGVVGMSMRNFASGIAATITRDPHKGVNIQINDNHIEIDLYVVLEYGVRIASVAASLINSVRYAVEKHCGMPVEKITVHVQGLRTSKASEK